MPDRPHVLVIAGTDSSGGAGLVRDIQVISEFGARASCVVTAVTAQTHHSVAATSMMPPELVRQQLSTALRSNSVSAIKIGMIGTGAIARVLLDELPDRRQIPIVIDPVLVSSSGTTLLDREGLMLLRDQLLARASLVTPNLPEAATLLGQQAPTTDIEPGEQATRLLQFGPEYVLLKGGHGLERDAVDILASRSAAPSLLRARRLDATVRGTGCALGSAVAALLAAGMPMESACRRAKAYVYEQMMSTIVGG